MSSALNPSLATLASTTAPKRSLGWYLSWGILLVLLAASWKGADMRPLDLLSDSGNMARYAAEFFPPNFAQWQLYLQEMLVTLQIALWGTALAVLTAVPLALLASSNIVLGLLASSNITPWWVHQPVRRLMDAFRAINEMVFAMLFVVAVGLGPFAGVLALWIHTSGTLAKLFSEAVEAIDPQPVEGIRSTGASALHEIIYGVIPQVMPLWISFTLYRFEANVRSASVVGMVGAGCRDLRRDAHHRGHRECHRSGVGAHTQGIGLRGCAGVAHGLDPDRHFPLAGDARQCAVWRRSRQPAGACFAVCPSG